MVDLSPHGLPDPGIALALGSAFLGMYAHTGFLCGLNEAGIFPGHISGSSAGAIAGGIYAAGFRGEDLQREVLSRAFKRSFTDPGMLVRWAPIFALGKVTGVMSGKRMIAYLKRLLPVSTLEELEGIKLSLAVTDLKNLKGSFLTRGPLAESIMASCSVPLLFSGQHIDGTEYHDGGILHELPIEPFMDDPAVHTVILHSLTYPGGRQCKQLKVQAVLANSHQILNDALLDFRCKQAEANGKRVIIINTEHPHPGLFQSQTKKKRYFDEGYRAGLALKEELAS